MTGFLDMLDLVETGPDVYVSAGDVVPLGGGDGFTGRIFGGLLMAQALRAAALTVRAEQRVHSLHCYFVGPTRPGPPVEFAVERTRDGRSVAARRVVAQQEGKVICTVSMSFHTDQPGADVPSPTAVVPDPGALPAGDAPPAWAGFDVRLLPIPEEVAPMSPAVRFWVRPLFELSNDPVISACVVAYISDMHAGSAPGILMGPSLSAGLLPMSLDHSVWFHRSANPHDWLLSEVSAVSTSGSRGLVFGTVHTQSGLHVATLTQEIMLR